MEPVVESALETPDGYWRVEVVRYRPGVRFYRIIHGSTVVHDRAVIAVVRRILGDAMALLEPADMA